MSLRDSPGFSRSIVLAAVFIGGCSERPTLDVTDPYRENAIVSDTSVWSPDADGDGWTVDDGDCDDAEATVHPGVAETCDDVDNDCDGDVDEGVDSVFFLDWDQDGFGDDASKLRACEAPSGYVSDGGDCDDDAWWISPDRPEYCDGVDEDCDGEIDDGATVSIYEDVDGDGYGDPATLTQGCVAEGWIARSEDCDDGDLDVYPGADERCNGADDDCDGAPLPDEVDLDGDTELACADCDETEPLAWSDAVEVDGDGVDNDCNGVIDDDAPACDQVVAHHLDSVQAAIDAAAEGDVICLAGGTYSERVDLGGAAVTLWGVHGAAITILDGRFEGRVVQLVSGEGPDTVLAGLTVTRGLVESGVGGGIWIVDASPTLRDLVVSDNWANSEAGWGGGGVAVEGGAPTLTRVTVTGNVAYYYDGSGYGRGYGGGLLLSGDDSVLESVAVVDNYAGGGGGGMLLMDSAAALFGCDVRDNRALENGAGLEVVDGAPTFENVRITANECSTFWGCIAGGVWLSNSEAHFTNVVISDNNAQGFGGAHSSYAGGVMVGGGSPVFTNVVISGNTANSCGGVDVASGSPTFTYSDIYGNSYEVCGIDDPAGVDGNLSVDPGFSDSLYHLGSTSAPVDAGDPALLDPDGSPSDIGLYGGPSAADRDLDGDGWPSWWLPGAYSATTSPDLDCDDLDAAVYPGSGC